MKRFKLIPTLLVVAGLVMVMTGGLSAFAAESASQGLSFINPVVSSLTLTGSNVDFGSITPGEPKEVIGAASVTGTSNASWNITLTGTKFTNGSFELALDDVLMVKTSEGSYSTIGSGKALNAGNNNPGNKSYSMDYKLTVPTDALGSSNAYTAELTYTIFSY